jgi:hypothetical protein
MESRYIHNWERCFVPRFDPWPGEFTIEEWDPDFRQRVSADGKTYGNVQEEPVRQWAAAQW